MYQNMRTLNKGMYYNQSERRFQVAKLQKTVSEQIKRTSPITDGLYEKLTNPYLLLHAFFDIIDFDTASGVDGKLFREFLKDRNSRSIHGLNPDKVIDFINSIFLELYTRDYKHMPLRKTTIDTGKKRDIFIPSIRDRVVQRAVVLLLDHTIFDPSFYNSSHAYRHNMGVKGAVLQVEEHILSGKTAVIDADITKFFNNIPHDLVISCFQKKVMDRDMVILIEKFITAPIFNKGEITYLEKGCHQGSLISPLLSNIVLHEFDQHFYKEELLRKYDCRIVRYADDFVVLKEGSISNDLYKYLENQLNQLGFEFHPDKTKRINLLRAYP